MSLGIEPHDVKKAYAEAKEPVKVTPRIAYDMVFFTDVISDMQFTINNLRHQIDLTNDVIQSALQSSDFVVKEKAQQAVKKLDGVK